MSKKIESPIGQVNEMLINGNAKIGKGVYHFSTLPGNSEYTFECNGKQYKTTGTCAGLCDGCYATRGNYRYASSVNALGIRTYLARNCLEWLENEINREIKAHNVKTIRIHASGDFFNQDYVDMWRRIVADNPTVTFWTYTKRIQYETAFDEYENANIVKSLIPGYGFNFGHCGYIETCYNELKAAGKSVHICKCGIDKNQHCTNCKGCATNDFVLFLEHGTGYNAAKDIDFPRLKEIIENQ